MKYIKLFEGYEEIKNNNDLVVINNIKDNEKIIRLLFKLNIINKFIFEKLEKNNFLSLPLKRTINIGNNCIYNDKFKIFKLKDDYYYVYINEDKKSINVIN